MKLKIFTVEEANALLPIIDGLLKDFQTKHRRMQEVALQWETRNKQERLPFTPASMMKRQQEELSHLEQKASELLRAIERTGCVLRDPYEGLIDFPGVKEKNPVYLCWKQGEEQIRFYHGVEDGFRGRQPL